MQFTEPLTFTETISKTYVAHSYNYHVDHIKLNEYAVISIIFYDKSQVYLWKKDVTIEGEQYANWGTDDSYIDDIVQAEIARLNSTN